MLSYTLIHYHILFILSLIFLAVGYSEDIRSQGTKSVSKSVGAFLLIFIVFYMGLRPLSSEFGDMGAYYGEFVLYRDNIRGLEDITGEVLIGYLSYFVSRFADYKFFFLVVDIIYIIPCYLFSKKYCGSYWGLAFFMFVGSFSFWSYGTNGIRNGMATSIFILALTYYNLKVLYYLLLLLAYNMHHSMMIPIAAVVASDFIKNPKLFFYIWLAAIPISLFAGGALQGLFASLVSDNRATDYLTKGNVNNDAFSSTGFRWDFVFYSGFAVFAGWYFIFRKKLNDRFYTVLWGAYMISNAFWIMVIKANFSNRFAYLSWFMMAAVIAYPMFKYRFSLNQARMSGLVLFVYFGFTYLLMIKYNL